MSIDQSKQKEIIFATAIKKLREDFTDISTKTDENSQNIVILDEKIGKIDEKLTEKIENIKLQKGDDGYTPVKGVDYFDGKDGDNYVLTPEDKQEIAKSIPVPVVEKIIEKTEVIKEQPIVTNEVKEVAVADTAEVLRDKLETLEGEDRLSISAIDKLQETLDEIRNTLKSTRIVNGRFTDRILIDDLTASCNGVDKTFTLSKEPINLNKIMVWGTDFPIILRPNVDWTLSRKTLTLTSEVPAPNTGATLLVQYTY